MLLRLIRDIDKERFDVTVLSQFEDELCRRLDLEEATVTIVPYRGALDVYDKGLLRHPIHKKFASLGRLLQFNIEARETLSDADVIWCDCLRSVLTIAPYGTISPTPVILNIGLGYESTGIRRALNTAALTVADHVFIESDHQARRLFTERQYRNNREKFTIFHKGIDTSEFCPKESASKDDELHVGTAATITPRKGHEYFVEAASRILKERDYVRFSIAGDVTSEGDREYERMLKQRIEREGIGDRVQFRGWIDDMPAYLNELDVFVLSSLNEGIPGAVREALAMEVPVVATDVGGTADVVIDGETGYLVESEDSEQLATAIERLLEDRERRERFGKAGRKRIVDEFSIEQYVNRYEEFLSRVA
nr:glycosyltransferase [Halalkalicoccus sp. NIPERK01]